MDVASKHFAIVQYKKLRDDLEDLIADEDVTKAKELVTGHQQIELGLGAGVDVMKDRNAWRSAFSKHSESLIKFPGALGKFFGDAFQRHGFVSIEGPEGRGKSYWLQEIAYRAVLQRRKVLFFELGDMTQDQLINRMGIRFAENPRLAGIISIPFRIRTTKKTTKGKDGDKTIIIANPVNRKKRFRLRQNVLRWV